jgi:hypothetical protein
LWPLSGFSENDWPAGALSLRFRQFRLSQKAVLARWMPARPTPTARLLAAAKVAEGTRDGYRYRALTQEQAPFIPSRGHPAICRLRVQVGRFRVAGGPGVGDADGAGSPHPSRERLVLDLCRR